MLDYNRNDHITLAQAAKLTPGRPSSCAVWRWCRVGVKSRTGERIRLDHIRIGGRLFTTESDLQRFFKLVAEADRAHFEVERPESAKPSTDRNRERSIERAEATLAKGGIL